MFQVASELIWEGKQKMRELSTAGWGIYFPIRRLVEICYNVAIMLTLTIIATLSNQCLLCS